MCECPLSSALLSGILGQGGTPLNVAVTVTSSDEVVSLRSQITALEGELSELRTAFNRAQYLYICEVQLNMQLQDLMNRAGVPFPHRLRTTGVVPDGFSAFLTKAAGVGSGASVPSV